MEIERLRRSFEASLTSTGETQSRPGIIPLDQLTPQETPMCRILIVDDHPTFRRGLAAVIGEERGLSICGEAGSAETGIDALRRLQPDMAIIDISLPGTNGIELIKMMLSEAPKLPILVVSVYDESRYGLRAFRAGAKGYLLKTEPPAQILSAIRTVGTGRLYVSLQLANRLIFKTIQSIDAGASSPLDALTDREFEVFELLGKGMGTEEIAGILHVSRKTIETHRVHIKEKLGCNTSSEMVRFAIDWVTRENG